MKRIDVSIQATPGVPMLMTTWYGMDPLNQIVQQMAQMRGIPSGRRTEEWHANYRKLDWTLGLYHDAKLGPYIPAECVEGNLKTAAKKKRLGKAVSAALIVDPAMIPLQYDGPRDIEKMWADGRFVDIRPCEAGTMKTRPMFHEWRLDYSIVFDEDVLDVASIKEVQEIGGIWGIGSYRPKFGKYDVISWKVKSQAA